MGVVVLVAAVALAVVVAVAWPLLHERRQTEPLADDQAGRALQDEIDRSLHAIREIEFDHRAGNLSDQDFAELDGAERAQLAALLRRRDESLG
jgi:Tfp pilus assembly protein PilN